VIPEIYSPRSRRGVYGEGRDGSRLARGLTRRPELPLKKGIAGKVSRRLAKKGESFLSERPADNRGRRGESAWLYTCKDRKGAPGCLKGAELQNKKSASEHARSTTSALHGDLINASHLKKKESPKKKDIKKPYPLSCGREGEPCLRVKAYAV